MEIQRVQAVCVSSVFFLSKLNMTLVNVVPVTTESNDKIVFGCAR